MSVCSSAERTTQSTSEFSSIPTTSSSENSMKMIYLQVNQKPSVSSPNTSPKKKQSNEKDFETIELQIPRKDSVLTNISCESNRHPPSTIEHYGDNETQRRLSNNYPITLPPLPARLSSIFVASPSEEDEYDSPEKRSFPVSILLLEIGALATIFIISMVLVLAIREEQVNLRTTMQVISSPILQDFHRMISICSLSTRTSI